MIRNKTAVRCKGGCGKMLEAVIALKDANGNNFCVDCYTRYGKSPLKRVDQGESSFVGTNRLEGKELLLG